MSPQQTMTERTKLIETFDREHQITMRLLKQYPEDKLGLKPSAKSSEAREVIWTMAMDKIVMGIVSEKNELTPEGLPKAPGTMAELIGALDGAHRETLAKLEKMSDAQMNTTIRMPVGPKQMGEVRRGDALWMFLYDSIHHRGQVSVYQRIAGGKVPSIYGPSADEPWF
jgi:uncharacterized damage-inducible protein DinB